jgi:antitoxin ParD1/3/4
MILFVFDSIWQKMPYSRYAYFERTETMATMNISLPDPMRDWVQEQIEIGKYASSSDYVRDLIRKDQEQRDKLAALQAAITQGLESGVLGSFNMDEIQSELDKQ